MRDDPVTVTPESAIADAAALDARILEVTRQLAFIQAINPNERDDQGFANSDYPAGFALAAAGRVEECASLLLLYPRQSQDAGLSLELLADRASLRVQGERDGGVRSLSKEERETARGQLRLARARVAGQLYWIETGDGEILFNGVGLTARTRTALSGLTRTPTGWRATISPVVLHRFMDRLGDEAPTLLDRFEALKTLAGARPATMEPPRPVKPTTTILSARVLGSQVALDWTLPFSDEGKALKDVVKACGARWDGDGRRWILLAGELAHAAYAGMLVPGVYLSEDLQQVTASLDAAVCSSIEQRVALLRQGLTLMEIVHETEDAFILRSSSRHDGIYNLMRSEGFRWVAAQTGYQVPRDQLPIAVTKLQALDGVDTSSLTERALREAERLVVRAEAHDATRASLQVLDITPGGRTLFPHQKEAVAHLLDPAWPHGRLLNDGVGSGKTAAAAMAAHLKTEGMTDARILIIAPAHLLSTWRRELQNTIGEREYIQVIESGADPISRFSRWTVMSYNNVVAQRERLEKLAPHLLILDEAHYLRHGDTAWTGALVGTRAKDGTETPGFAMQVPTVWPMTASEIVNNPRDLFGLLRITRHPLGDNFFRFGQRYCDGHQVSAGRRGMVWDFSGSSNLVELGEKLRHWILRRELDDVVQLPPKQDPVVRTVEFSPEERAAYRAGVRESIAAYKRGADVLTAMTAAMRACALAKTPHVIARVRELLESGGKVGVISRVPEVFDHFEAAFPGAVVRIDGSVRGADAKAAAERAFQTDPTKRICALQTRSGSGLTLTMGRQTAMVDIPFTNEDIVQAEGRFRRIGTTGIVTHERFHAPETFDPALARLTETKGARASEFRAGVQGTAVTDAAATNDRPPVSDVASAHAVMQELIRMERELSRADAPSRVGATAPTGRVGAEVAAAPLSIETALGA